MSTILKALKQVDQAAPPEDIHSWSPEIDTKQTVKTRVEKIRPNRKVYLIIVLALIVGAGGWLAYSQKDRLLARFFSGGNIAKDKQTSPASSQKDPAYQAKIDPRASKKPVKSVKKDPPPNSGIQPSDLKSGPGQTVTDRPPRRSAKIPIHKKIEKNQDIETSSQPGLPLRPAPSKSRITPSQSADPKNPNPGQSRTSVRSPVKQASSSYRRLDDSKLKLQAIAWSNDVAQRIAVVNGHIVREGESVEGYSVTQIRQDDIIVSDGTESWRLEFGLK